MSWVEKFGDPRINRRAEVDPLLREVLERACLLYTSDAADE